MIDVICEHCGETFKRSVGEYNRRIKRNSKQYCSLQCCGKATFTNIPAKDRIGKPEFLVKGGWQLNELSPFRQLLRSAKARTLAKNKTIHITLEDMKEQWDKQNGICPLTGWQLVLPKSTTDKLLKTSNRASLDRIDSSIDYTKDNIRFVSLIAQYAKNSWSDNDVIDFCRAVVLRFNGARQ